LINKQYTILKCVFDFIRVMTELVSVCLIVLMTGDNNKVTCTITPQQNVNRCLYHAQSP